jgi:hypothetical protein
MTKKLTEMELFWAMGVQDNLIISVCHDMKLAEQCMVDTQNIELQRAKELVIDAIEAALSKYRRGDYDGMRYFITVLPNET